MEPDAIAQIYASDIISGFDFYKPEEMNKLFRSRGDQGASYFQILRSLGFEEPAALDTYGHYEENRYHEKCIVDAIVAQPAVGATITFTLDSDSLDDNNNFYVRENDIILFPNEVTGHVTAIDVTTPTAPTVTCTLHDDTLQFPALTAGEELIIISDAWVEGSGQPEPALSGAWHYTNDAQIIKETIGFTGSEAVNQTWFNVMSDGTSIPSYRFKGQIEGEYRMALKIDGALLFGRRTVNDLLVDSETGRPIKTTEGLVPYIRRIGNEQTFTDGSFGVDEFDDMSYTLDREHAGEYIMGMLGMSLQTQVENTLKTYFNDTNIQYARQAVNEELFNSSESLGASVNFKFLTKSGRTFMFRKMGVFNHPNLYGATGYSMPKMGIFVPIDKQRNPITGDMIPSVGCRYRKLGPYSRRMETWQIGGVGPGMKITQYDKSDVYWRAHVGAHYIGGNRMVILEPAA